VDNENVVSPAGIPASRTALAAQRLSNLDAKVIGEVWNGDFKGDVTFPMLREELLKRHPSLRIVPFTEFPHTHVSDDPVRQRERATGIAERAKELGCDAVISGVGA
jgi:hypothetical protein